MSPARRERLTEWLAAAKDTARRRAAHFTDLPDETVKALTGISNIALARRVVATPRVAARLAHRLPTLSPVVPNSSDPQPVNEQPAPSPTQPADAPAGHDGAETLDHLACAIRLSTFAALPAASDLIAARQSYSDDALAFALSHRADVPAWIRAVAGGRDDVVRQLAATCLVCAGDGADASPWPAAISDCAPLQVMDWYAREEAAALARKATDWFDARRQTALTTEPHA